MVCPKCGLTSAGAARFCSHCGESFPNIAAEPAAAGAAAGAAAAAAPLGAGSAPGILDRIKNLLLNPNGEWPAIAAEPTSIAQLYTSYVMPLAGLSALMTFLRLSVIGIDMPFGGTFRTPLLSGLTMAVVSFGFGLLGLFLAGLIINAWAPTFAGVSDRRQAVKTAAYASTPALIASVLAFLGGLGGLLQLAAAIYGIYLLYLGLPVMMKAPRERATGYTATVVVCAILMGILLGLVNAAVSRVGGYGPFPGAGMSRAEQQQQAAATVGNVIGSALGTDQKGKDGLSAAINNLAEAGKNLDRQRDNPAGAPAAGAPAAADAANPAPNPVAATAGVLTALGGAMAGSRRADPVDFHLLKDLLPASLPDMQRSDAEGSAQQALGIKGSSASANYSGQSGARTTIKISDMTGVSGLLDLANTLGASTSSESDSGFEKDTTVGGRTVHEKYDNRSKHGEITAIVDKRFMVEISGDGLDMGSLERSLGTVDFSRLDAMKDMGAHPNP